MVIGSFARSNRINLGPRLAARRRMLNIWSIIAARRGKGIGKGKGKDKGIGMGKGKHDRDWFEVLWVARAPDESIVVTQEVFWNAAAPRHFTRGRTRRHLLARGVLPLPDPDDWMSDEWGTCRPMVTYN